MLKSWLLIIHPLEVDVPCIDEDAQKLAADNSSSGNRHTLYR
ncbi:MAG: hypothetical protein ACM65K_01815 [Microcoleus sp.]